MKQNINSWNEISIIERDKNMVWQGLDTIAREYFWREIIMNLNRNEISIFLQSTEKS